MLILSFLFPFFSYSQSENSLLWKITEPKSGEVSYLFGTIHSNDSTLNTFDKTWWKCFNACETFAGEVNMTNMEELMSSISTSIMKDASLEDFYSEVEFIRVRTFILERFDPITAMMVTRMKPFYIMATIMELPSSEGPYTEIMDMRLQTVATEKGMTVIGLETVEEQAASIDVISLEQQAKLLLEYVDHGYEINVELATMEKFYLNQNLDSLAAMEIQAEVPEVLMESILEGRNIRFAEKLIPFLVDGSVFCGVGALHLPGNSGLIAQLRKRGFVVAPVSFRFGN